MRALGSVVAQTCQPCEISVAVDHDHQGAAATRNRAWRNSSAEWIAFLDDDDELLPHHLEALLAAHEATGADLVFPWFEVVGGTDPLAINGQPVLGHPFDDEAREHLLTVGNHIPVTVLVRRAALEAVGGFPQPGSDAWSNPTCEDWGCWIALLNAGYQFHHHPEVTWVWRHHCANTSGDPTRWR